MVQNATDRRVARSRLALRNAFNKLMLTRGYKAIGPADIAAAADVGRSTFYTHYRSKEAVFAECVVVILDPLAGMVATEDFDPLCERVVSHLWDNRRLAAQLMANPCRKIMGRVLTELLEQRLGEEDGRFIIPVALLASQIAHGQLAALDAWLTGRHACSAGTVARSLHLTARAIALAAETPDGAS